MQHILRDNALVAWRSAIEYCDEIIQGKATLKYRKNFVASLHNAVELFLKQFMLDTNDHRVCFIHQIKRNDPEGLLKKRYEAAEDITQFFNSLPAEDAAKFHSIEYNKLLNYTDIFFEEYYSKYGQSSRIVSKALHLLGKLRNNETHFFVNKWEFLIDAEFELLHNFMLIFYKILLYYDLLPFWGKPFNEYKKLGFEREKIHDFSYQRALQQSDIMAQLRETLKDEPMMPYVGHSAFEIAQQIVYCVDSSWKNRFDELWICIELALHFDMIEIEGVIEEYDDPEFGYGVNRCCYLTIR